MTGCLGRLRALFIDERGVVLKAADVNCRRTIIGENSDVKAYLSWSDRTVQPHV